MDSTILFDLMQQEVDLWEDRSLILMTWALGVVFFIFSKQLAPFFSLSWMRLPSFMDPRRDVTGAKPPKMRDPVAELKKFRRTLAAGMVIMPVFFVGFKVLESSRVEALREHYVSGSYSQVVGIVEQFQPTKRCVTNRRVQSSGDRPSRDTRPNESFQIEDTVFVYSDQLVTGGFRQTFACGGPIREGLNLKIWHVNGIIIRIERLGDGRST